ncbi:MAG: FAD-dependent oxidoreductase [bacterium]
MKISIDKKQFEFTNGETILQVAKRNGIKIPSLCFDERFKPQTTCFICIVKDEKSKKIIPSCSVKALDGMSIITDDEEIKKYRKMALELLLSEHDADCFSPCKTACPAGIDVRDYILFSRIGQELNGFVTVRKKNPLVAVVGRVCPAFCENDCSRNNIDETVNIRLLKKYLGDSVYETLYDELFKLESSSIKKSPSSKKIAIIGAGPAGLSASYYLSLAGCNVSLYDSNEKLGGMLRYAIPSYRLPSALLDKEIDSITRLGVEVFNNYKVDTEELKKISKKNDHVLLSIGTWKETALGLDESKYANVIPAVSFLRNVFKGNIKSVGNRVVVIGGGNSAIDAARVCIRFGAKVSLAYRRTRKEMPALNIEIEDALKEGVELFELMNPFEVIPSMVNGVAGAIKFRKMVLSDECDNSGRRKIKDTDDFKTFDLDTLVYAIGQKAEPELIDSIKAMGLNNVIVCGDARTGASTVIEAVADGRKTAEKILKITKDELAFYSLREKGILACSHNDKQERVMVSHLSAPERIHNFREIESGYEKIYAVKESERCINCGCSVLDECELRKYSIDYNADPNKYKQVSTKDKKVSTGVIPAFSDQSLKHMLHEPSKCIKCGKCISVCKEVAGVDALSFIGRGLGVVLSSNTKNMISESSCTLCGMCIDSCPTGSLSENIPNSKWTGFEERIAECQGCYLKCKIKYAYNNKKSFRGRSSDTPICSIGRWGWNDNYEHPEKYYTNKIKDYKTVLFDTSKITDGEFLKLADIVLCLNSVESSDNPRLNYELDILRNNDVSILNLALIKELPDLKKYSRPVLVFNYFNYDPKRLNAFIDKIPNIKLLPIYYKVI